MKLNNYFWLAVCFLAVPALLFAQDNIRTMNYVEPQLPLSFSSEADDRVGLHLVSMIYSPLVDRDFNGIPQPRLLESIEPTYKKNGIFRFQLKRGLKWFAYNKKGELITDSRTGEIGFKDFTAKDVEFTFAQFRQNQSVKFGFVTDIFSNVRAISDYVVEFELRHNFSIPFDQVSDLNLGNISDRLRSDFAENKIVLFSPQLQTERQGQEWVIKDQEETKDGTQIYTYVIRRATGSANELRVFDLYRIDLTFVLQKLEFPIIPNLQGIDTTQLRRFRNNELVISTGPFAMSEEGADGIRLLKTCQSLGEPSNRSEVGFPIDRVVLIDRTDIPAIFPGFLADLPRYHLLTELHLGGYNEIKQRQEGERQEEKKTYDRVALQRHSINRMTYFAFNYEKVFKNDNLRLAFAYAFDKKEAFRLAYGQYFPDETNLPLRDIKKIIHSPLPSHKTPPDILIIEPNESQARNYLSRSGLSSTQLEQGFELLCYYEDDQESSLCTEFKGMIERILRIPIRPVQVTKDEWFRNTREGNYDIAFGRADFPDTTNIIEILFGFTSRKNFSRYAGSLMFTIPRADANLNQITENLTRRTLPSNLRQAFTQNGIILSQNVKIPASPLWRNGWLLEDLDKGQVYVITRDSDGINVFKNELEPLLRAYNESKNTGFRETRMDDMARLIAKEVPFLFVTRIPRFAVYRNDILGGVNIEPYYFFTFIDRWYFLQ